MRPLACQIRNKKGFTLIELVVTMAILAILGATVSGLVHTGLAAYRNNRDEMNDETEARTALSLITIQIRQHDATGAITYDIAGGVLRLRDDPAYQKGLVIWFEDGAVYSEEVTSVTAPVSKSDPEATAIAQVYSLQIEVRIADDGVTQEFNITIGYGESGKKSISQSIAQRSAVSGS